MSGLFIDNLSRYEKASFINKVDNTYQHFFDYFTTRIINFFATYIPPILLNNLLIILCLCLVLITSYYLFLHLTKNNKPVALIFSLFYSFSAYFISRVFSFTPPLYCTFVFPLILLLFIKNRSPLLLGLLTFFSFTLSSYYGFFAFVLIVFWILIPDDTRYFKKIKYIGIYAAVLLVFMAIFFWKPLISNIPLGGNTNFTAVKQEIARSGSSLAVYRPIENWYSFSFRPWYFFIPPKSSLFFGSVSKQIYDRIAQTGNYLAVNYSDDEMTGVFFGWHFYLGAGLVLYLLALQRFRKKTYRVFPNVYGNKGIILKSAVVFILILLISGPPSITIHGVEIFTPSYLLYYLVPGFRTLVRWVSVLYLLLLVINVYLVLDLYALMKKNYQKALLLIGILALNFVITAVKLPVLDISRPPEEIAYLRDVSKDKFSYAVYPKGDYYSMFWILSSKKVLINAVGSAGYDNEFDAEKFSKNLITEGGLEDLAKYNVLYLVYYPNKITNADLEEIRGLNPNIKSLSDVNSFFFAKYGKPLSFSNGARIYSFNYN